MYLIDLIRSNAFLFIIQTAIPVIVLLGTGLYTLHEKQKSEVKSQKAEKLLEESSQNSRESREKISTLLDQIKIKDDRIEILQKNMQELEQKTAATFFTLGATADRTLPDGSVEKSFELLPQGTNPVPIFSIIVHSKNATKIKDLRVTGRTVPVMSEGGRNTDSTALKTLYRSFQPAPGRVTVVTEKQADLEILIDPFKKDRP